MGYKERNRESKELMGRVKMQNGKRKERVDYAHSWAKYRQNHQDVLFNNQNLQNKMKMGCNEK